MSKTAADHWREGARLNLERALRLGDEIGGHIVTGHVDALAEVGSVRPDGDSTRIDLSVPKALAPMIAPKGSITLDGVSLTVNEVRDGSSEVQFSVNIIPHTAQQTTLRDLNAGQQLNVEIDVLARYIDRMIAARAH
jgi:riboflavin synthase